MNYSSVNEDWEGLVNVGVGEVIRMIMKYSPTGKKYPQKELHRGNIHIYLKINDSAVILLIMAFIPMLNYRS